MNYTIIQRRLLLTDLCLILAQLIQLTCFNAIVKMNAFMKATFCLTSKDEVGGI